MRKILFEGIAQGSLTERPPVPDEAALAELAKSVNNESQIRLGRSLSIRQVDAGSCNGCELEIHALNNAFYDLERFGLRFVASPRHADVLMVTGREAMRSREGLKTSFPLTCTFAGARHRRLIY
jgi:NADH:ubiquinone oxidoreductase subunit B-like Fe-S oxidoreductase